MSSEKNIAEPDFKEFYNYRYWRETQRKQLTITSNIFFTLNIASIGFIINYLLFNNYKNESILLDLFFCAIFFFVISAIVYILLNIFRLIDYRKTARFIKDNNTFEYITKETICLGKTIWVLLYTEIISSTVGFLVTLFAFYQIIFKV